MADTPISPDSQKDADDDTGMPRWVKVLGLVTLVVVLLLVILLLAGGGGGGGGHGPGRHTP
ncbi:MAG: hypothetical protein H0T70_05590 [Acidimicrobiia bacterium]|nr:hypothetical protein [Acidimicrobiia bacterium]